MPPRRRKPPAPPKPPPPGWILCTTCSQPVPEDCTIDQAGNRTDTHPGAGCDPNTPTPTQPRRYDWKAAKARGQAAWQAKQH